MERVVQELEYISIIQVFLVGVDLSFQSHPSCSWESSLLLYNCFFCPSTLTANIRLVPPLSTLLVSECQRFGLRCIMGHSRLLDFLFSFSFSLFDFFGNYKCLNQLSKVLLLLLPQIIVSVLHFSPSKEKTEKKKKNQFLEDWETSVKLFRAMFQLGNDQLGLLVYVQLKNMKNRCPFNSRKEWYLSMWFSWFPLKISEPNGSSWPKVA